MGKKVKTAEQQIQDLRQNILDERSHWKYLNNNGCNDPFWPDGCNMNLTRNHIIYYRKQIEEICEENGLQLPVEYFLTVPPQVDNNYMANLKQKKRVESLKKSCRYLTTKKAKFVDDGQLSFC